MSMATIEERARGSQTLLDLLVETCKSVREISQLLRNNETNREHKRFYSHLAAHCLMVSDHGARLKASVDPKSELELIIRALNHFESIVASKALHVSSTSSHPWQRSLNRRWKIIRGESDIAAKLELARQCLDFEPSPDLGDEDDFWETWEDEVNARFPEDELELSAESHSVQAKRRAEPSYTVWNAAQSLSKALVHTMKCACSPAHELGARLCLGTHRNPGLDEGSNDFCIFLSSQQNLREAHVHTIRKRMVQFASDDKIQRRLEKGLEYNPTKVRELCEQIRRKPIAASYRLEFEVREGRLWKLQSKPSAFHIDKAKTPISLQHFIRQRPRSLTAKTKCILAVLLSYAVLHLHGTPWLESTWDSSSILFFQTSASRIPLKPFIQTRLDAGQQGTGQQGREDRNPDNENSGEEPDEIDPDDLYGHPFPVLVTLAAMLMELYLATPFEELARVYGLVDTVSRTCFIDVACVFEKVKSDIPRNSKFCFAIENCLARWAWGDDSGQVLDDKLLRAAIYQNVIQPLEDELCDAFPAIGIEKLDETVETVDFGNWGQIIEKQQDRRLLLKVPGAAEAALPRQSRPVLGPERGFSPSTVSLRTRVLMAITRGTTWNHQEAKFFDGESIVDEHHSAKRGEYSDWRRRFQDVYARFIEPHALLSPVKIAVLDTGIDETHPDLFAKHEQIKARYNWTSTKHNGNVQDHNGHGTFTAGLLLEYAPDAELYVAKIAKDKPSHPRLIAEAIDLAVDMWKVDIISMPFGYTTDRVKGYKTLEEAILRAYSKHVLMFAAASNSGANLDRAYPARDQNVICVHSTDGQGNRSRFSPTALTNDVNLATIGEAIESTWPVHLCDRKANPQCLEHKSGTSYATPIAVGIAAFLLQYARIHLPNRADMLKRQSRMKKALLKASEKSQQSENRDGYNYLALSCYDDNLFGKDQDFIDSTLRDILGESDDEDEEVTSS